MAIEKTAIDGERLVTPKVITESITMDEVTVTKIVNEIADDPAAIMTSDAIAPW